MLGLKEIDAVAVADEPTDRDAVALRDADGDHDAEGERVDDVPSDFVKLMDAVGVVL